MSLSTMNILHFADDSTSHIKFDTNVDISQQFNLELAYIDTWLSANKLYLNIDKTKYMILSNRSQTSILNLKVGNSIIDKTATHTFLGIIIDETLTLTSQVNKLCYTISRSMGKLSYLVPRKVLRKLHFAFVYSRFTNGLTTWESINKTVFRRIFGVIDRSIKIVTCAGGNTVESCKSNKIMNLTLAYDFFC